MGMERCQFSGRNRGPLLKFRPVRPICPRDMIATVFQQLSTYPAGEWVFYIAITFLLPLAGGLTGMMLSHGLLFFAVLHSDMECVMANPEADLDAIFFFGFISRFVAMVILLFFCATLPSLLSRKWLLGFDSWQGAFLRWRVWRHPERPAGQVWASTQLPVQGENR